ncbi:hypothetical protein VPH35_139906 [Triticum aestivum]|uniref:Uncharacterized protein n=1 Tax=Aegilops tauschii TaxID=37682 RepID=M8BRY2_AEGTA
MAATIPDDVVLEILLRVSRDVAALFRCAATCKRWRTLIADLSFLGRCWPDNACHPSSFLGFFVQQRRDPDDRDELFVGVDIDSPQPPVFLPAPAPWPVLGPRRRFLASLLPGLPAGLLDGAQPLTARHGLLLVRLARGPHIHMAMCDPLNGTFHVLPPIKRRAYSANCAILTDADCSSPSGPRRPAPSPDRKFFKVLAIVVESYRDRVHDCDLYTFSSTGSDWSTPARCLDEICDYGKRGFRVLQETQNVAVCRGTAHWLVEYWSDKADLSSYHTLDIDAATGHVSLTELSIPMNQLTKSRYSTEEPTLCTAVDGTLLLFYMCMEAGLGRLDIWTWPGGVNEESGGRWLLARVVELRPPMEEWDPMFVRVWSGQKSGVLFIVDSFAHVYKVDAEAGAMEDVTGLFGGCLGTMALPLEIDWPLLFVSRLGGRSQLGSCYSEQRHSEDWPTPQANN